MSAAQRFPDRVVAAARQADVAALAARYGFSARANAGGEAVGPCPGCGGRDRFSVNHRKNIWRCRQGGGDPIGGDAIALVQHVENCSFVRAVEILTGEEVPAAPDPAAQAAAREKARREADKFREKERRRAFALWRESHVPERFGGMVESYLAGRAIDPDLARMEGAHCREHDALPFWHFVDTGRVDTNGRPVKEWRVIHVGPAMVWPIVDRDGRFLGIHATWIDPETRRKAEIFDPDTGEQLPAKKVRGSKRGGRIVLRLPDWRGCDEAVAGEGIETCLSWFAINRRDVFLDCAVDLGNLAGRAARTVRHPTQTFQRRDGRRMPVRVPGPDPRPDDDPAKLYAPPAGVARLTLLGDSDSDTFATRAAMLRAQARLSSDALAVATEWAPAGHDFNSYLQRIREDDR
ncbi:DUF7146 domain-containing protein [Oricola thermophila]|uniref:DNA primase n=1 Tax=Oricola thermophila TaxID=2742145 RepID=A0A6N1VIK1_9HYPH|nr:DNA primase [Oricola thermophila]QKV20263.1 DNA primase [Oricola thermophila]